MFAAVDDVSAVVVAVCYNDARLRPETRFRRIPQGHRRPTGRAKGAPALSIGKDQVRHVADLARLALHDHEVDELSAQLSRILEHMEKLRELDTTGVPPTAHVLPLRNAWREDAPRPGLSVEEALANAPEREGNCFKVPKIVDTGGDGR